MKKTSIKRNRSFMVGMMIILGMSSVALGQEQEDPPPPFAKEALGQAFNLPASDILSGPATGGYNFFKNAAPENCIHSHDDYHESYNNVRTFSETKSFYEFVKAEAHFSGQKYDVENNFFMTGSIDANWSKGTRKDYSIRGRSAIRYDVVRRLELLKGALYLDPEGSGEQCTPLPLDEGMTEAFTRLPIDISNPHLKQSWLEYEFFFNNHGTHLVVDAFVGSLFYSTHLVEKDSEVTEEQIGAKACFDIEGEEPWAQGPDDDKSSAVSGCAKYSKEDRAAASKELDTRSFKVLGGTKETHDNFSNFPSPSTLAEFMSSAHESEQAVQFGYKPVWEVLYERFQSDPNSVKRVKNMRQFFDGYLSFGCSERLGGEKRVPLRQFVFSDTNKRFECRRPPMGCRASSDCKGRWLQTYCYGATCIATGTVDGRTESVIRTTRDGGTNDPPNDSCEWHTFKKNECKNPSTTDVQSWPAIWSE